MQVVLLGTAAGGGFPQWNCWCPSCRVARQRSRARAVPRSQSSAAVSADGERWFLLNASPDVHEQLGRLPRPAARRRPARAGRRHRPDRRRAGPHAWHRAAARGPAAAGLAPPTRSGGSSRTTRGCSRSPGPSREVTVTELMPDQPIGALLPRRQRRAGSGSRAFRCRPVRRGSPREERPGHTVGLLVRDERTGGLCAFVPGCGGLDDGAARAGSAARTWCCSTGRSGPTTS